MNSKPTLSAVVALSALVGCSSSARNDGTGPTGGTATTGTFFEGAITSGSPGDAVDDQIQANIVAAGYGK